MRKNKSVKKNMLYMKVVSILIIIFIAVIVAANLFAIIYIVLYQYSCFEVKYSKIEFANIIALLGIAISVWIGGAIVNSLDKQKLNELDENLMVVKKAMDETMESRRDSISKQFKLIDEPIGRWMADQIDLLDKDVFIDSALYDLLVDEEKSFQLLRENRATKRGKIIAESYEIIIRGINVWIKSHSKYNIDPLKLVVEVRNMQRLFEEGYLLGKDYSIDNYVNVTVIYNKIKNKLIKNDRELYDKNFNEIMEMIKDKISYDTVEYRELEKDAHIFYMVGESYSKMAQYYNDTDRIPTRKSKEYVMEEVYENAEKFEIKAITISKVCKEISGDIVEVPEYFYRGYGCTIERCEYGKLIVNYDKKGKMNYKKAIKCLEKALEQYELSYKIECKKSYMFPNKLNYIFHVITSVNDKIFWLKQKKIPSKLEMFKNLKLQNDSKLEKTVKEKYEYVSRYIMSYPSYPHVYYIKACYLFNLFYSRPKRKYYDDFKKAREEYMQIVENNTLGNKYIKRLDCYNNIMDENI